MLQKILLVLLAFYSCQVLSADRLPGGIAVTPKNFPKHSPQDMQSAFARARKTGRHAVFIMQWGEFKPEVMKNVVRTMRANRLVPVLGISPTTLDQGRKELDMPASVKRQARGNVSFANPLVQREFINTVKQIARLRPEYLCLATEINFLALQRSKEYLHFVRLYKRAYREAKRISPRSKVFVSFQWEWIRILDSKALHRVKEHSKLYQVFKPELDVVGLTTYPSPYHKSPADLPADYYSWVFKHFARNEKFLLMEVGWPSRQSGSPQEQVSFIRRLPGLLRTLDVKVVAWSLLHDVNLAQFDANLNSTGLIRSDGVEKPAYRSWLTIVR